MDDSRISDLAKIESEISVKLSALHAQHAELQLLDYDSDPRVLRPYLDSWMDWHLWASYWLVQAKQVRVLAKQDFDKAWQKVLSATRSINLATELEFHSSFEERKVYYDKRTYSQRMLLEQLESTVSTVYDFISILKTVISHWDKRRVDTKWEIDRMRYTPSSDYD